MDPQLSKEFDTGVAEDQIEAAAGHYSLGLSPGTTWKALIEEEFGDGIMSAIDFHMDIQREKSPSGDRVKLNLSGKFLPYKRY
jgi:cyanate lyase